MIALNPKMEIGKGLTLLVVRYCHEQRLSVAGTPVARLRFNPRRLDGCPGPDDRQPWSAGSASVFSPFRDMAMNTLVRFSRENMTAPKLPIPPTEK